MKPEMRPASAAADLESGGAGIASATQEQSAFDSLEEFEVCAEIARSGYFDEAFYLENSPDVAAADLDPLAHYVRYGEREGRRPCRSVNLEELRKQFDNGQCLLLQYIRSLEG